MCTASRGAGFEPAFLLRRHATTRAPSAVVRGGIHGAGHEQVQADDVTEEEDSRVLRAHPTGEYETDMAKAHAAADARRRAFEARQRERATVRT